MLAGSGVGASLLTPWKREAFTAISHGSTLDFNVHWEAEMLLWPIKVVGCRWTSLVIVRRPRGTQEFTIRYRVQMLMATTGSEGLREFFFAFLWCNYASREHLSNSYIMFLYIHACGRLSKVHQVCMHAPWDWTSDLCNMLRTPTYSSFILNQPNCRCLNITRHTCNAVLLKTSKLENA